MRMRSLLSAKKFSVSRISGIEIVASESRVDRSSRRSEYRVHLGPRNWKERTNNHWIELRSARCNQPSRGFFEGQAFAIRPRRHHRVIRINDANNSRDDGNLGIFQARRI